MKKLLIVLFLVMFLVFPLISANGLSINPSQISVNRTIGIDKFVNITITNEEPVDFQGVKFETNSQISIEPFNLSSGENKTINAEIISTQDFSGVIDIKGFYESDLGQQNETHNIVVDYDDGLDKCGFSIVQGDTVIWKNNVPSSIRMINADNGNTVTEIDENSSYSELFDQNTSLSYYFTRFGVKFTNTCTISVLGTSGLINNPEYDTSLALDVKVNYEPTNISTTILEDEYTIEAGEFTEDLLSIKNVGNKIAKNIKLEAEWFIFSSNNFDLEPGQSRNVGYTITPQITETNQTGKTHDKELKISGNFDAFTHTFKITIPYRVIDESFNQDTKTIQQLFEERYEFVKAYCNDNPNNELCTQLVTTFSSQQQGNETDADLEFKKALINEIDKDGEFRKFVIGELEKIKSDTFQSSNQSALTLKKVDSLESKQGDYQMGVNFAASTLLLLIICVGGVIIYMKREKNKKREKFETYY